MEQRRLSDLTASTKRVALVGLAKNTGKTETLAALLRELQALVVAGPGQPVDALKHEAFLKGLSHEADPDVILFGPAGLKLLANTKATDSELRSFVSKSGGTAFDEVRDVTAVAVVDIAHCGSHAAFGHHRVRLAEQRLADDADLESVLRSFNGSAINS